MDSTINNDLISESSQYHGGFSTIKGICNTQDGYEGPLCSTCSIGYALETISQACIKCDNLLSIDSKLAIGLLLLIPVVMLIPIFICNTLCCHSSKKYQDEFMPPLNVKERNLDDEDSIGTKDGQSLHQTEQEQQRNETEIGRSRNSNNKDNMIRNNNMYKTNNNNSNNDNELDEYGIDLGQNDQNMIKNTDYESNEEKIDNFIDLDDGTLTDNMIRIIQSNTNNGNDGKKLYDDSVEGVKSRRNGFIYLHEERNTTTTTAQFNHNKNQNKEENDSNHIKNEINIFFLHSLIKQWMMDWMQRDDEKDRKECLLFFVMSIVKILISYMQVCLFLLHSTRNFNFCFTITNDYNRIIIIIIILLT